jgi:hypothetical protein
MVSVAGLILSQYQFFFNTVHIGIHSGVVTELIANGCCPAVDRLSWQIVLNLFHL